MEYSVFYLFIYLLDSFHHLLNAIKEFYENYFILYYFRIIIFTFRTTHNFTIVHIFILIHNFIIIHHFHIINTSAVDNSLIGERNAHFQRKNVARGKNEFSFLSVYLYICLSKVCIYRSRYRIYTITT